MHSFKKVLLYGINIKVVLYSYLILFYLYVCTYVIITSYGKKITVSFQFVFIPDIFLYYSLIRVFEDLKFCERNITKKKLLHI